MTRQDHKQGSAVPRASLQASVNIVQADRVENPFGLESGHQ